MSLYYEWHDIVVYPLDPSRINSAAERLDTSKAVDLSDGFSPEIHEFGAIRRQNDVIYDGSEFEAMEVDDYGNVTVWTREHVCFLMRDRGLEKLLCVRRHPHSL